jgi:hypothetical protein
MIKPNAKKPKYGAKKTVIDGITFASAKEARRYSELSWLAKAGSISGLELQPRFPVVINGVKVCTYIADFAYFDGKSRVIEDVKGFKTPIYKLKKKLVEAVFVGVTIKEV